jgi:hypothetical protein
MGNFSLLLFEKGKGSGWSFELDNGYEWIKAKSRKSGSKLNTYRSWRNTKAGILDVQVAPSWILPPQHC